MKLNKATQQEVESLLDNLINSIKDKVDNSKDLDTYGWYEDLFYNDLDVTDFPFYPTTEHEEESEYADYRSKEDAVAAKALQYPSLLVKIEKIIKMLVDINRSAYSPVRYDDETVAGECFSYRLALTDKKYIPVYTDLLLTGDFDHEVYQTENTATIINKWGWIPQTFELIIARCISDAQHKGEELYELKEELSLRSVLEDEDNAREFLSSLFNYCKRTNICDNAWELSDDLEEMLEQYIYLEVDDKPVISQLVNRYLQFCKENGEDVSNEEFREVPEIEDRASKVNVDDFNPADIDISMLPSVTNAVDKYEEEKFSGMLLGTWENQQVVFYLIGGMLKYQKAGDAKSQIDHFVQQLPKFVKFTIVLTKGIANVTCYDGKDAHNSQFFIIDENDNGFFINAQTSYNASVPLSKEFLEFYKKMLKYYGKDQWL